MVILALDVGESRIGVAVSDELELTATPRPLIRRKSTDAALAAVAQAIAQAEAQLVIVGLPVSFDGHLHAQARAIQAFAAKLRRRISQPLIFSDETLSSVRAEERLRQAGVRPERLRERIDSEAAAIILEDVLEQRRRARAAHEPQAPTESVEPYTPPEPYIEPDAQPDAQRDLQQEDRGR